MDDFLFSDEPHDVAEPQEVGRWKVIIVDDEPEVHAVTKLALSDFEFQKRSWSLYLLILVKKQKK